MKNKENLILTKEEKEKLEWVIDWYYENWCRLDSYGININEDLFDIILAVLRKNEKNS